MCSRRCLLSVLIITSTLLVGYLFGNFIPFKNETLGTSAENYKAIRSQGGYSYINPLVECDTYDPKILSNLSQIESDVKSFVEESKKDGDIDSVAVLFRNLNQGGWFSINDEEMFSPASLSKLPVVIAYLKESEVDPSILKKKLKYEPEFAEFLEKGEQTYAPSKTIEPEKEYTVEELIQYSLEYSDNRSSEVLFLNIDNEKIIQVMKDLDIYSSFKSPYDLLTVKDYSVLLRILYNATYLSRENSEWLLSTLAKADFDVGISAAIPEEIPVANKFGEKGYIIFDPDPNHIGNESYLQLHDCGIIYEPNTPYILCIMTKGHFFSELEKVLSGISEIVYQGISESQ